MKTKDRCGKLEGKTGISMKTQALSCMKAGMLLKTKEVDRMSKVVGGEKPLPHIPHTGRWQARKSWDQLGSSILASDFSLLTSAFYLCHSTPR
jgi:hypothetical protein